MKPDGRFAIGELAAMVGLSPHTIRAWERRYGVLTPERSASGRRQYNVEDVDFILRVKQLASARGLSIRLAIMEARGVTPAEPRALPPERAAEVDVEVAGGAWRSVADLLPSLILLLDEGGRIVDANIAVARITGQLRRELRGTRFLDLVEPHDRAKAARAYRAPLQQRRGWELNLRTKSAQGLYSLDCWPIRQGNGWLVACIGRDLSQAGLDLWPASESEPQ